MEPMLQDSHWLISNDQGYSDTFLYLNCETIQSRKKKNTEKGKKIRMDIKIKLKPCVSGKSSWICSQTEELKLQRETWHFLKGV